VTLDHRPLVHVECTPWQASPVPNDSDVYDSAASIALEARVNRVKMVGSLGSRSVRDAACEFHALCEGLAAVELRGQMTSGEETRIWRDALTALVAGFGLTARPGGSGATVS
jgi:hypothetical protein